MHYISHNADYGKLSSNSTEMEEPKLLKVNDCEAQTQIATSIDNDFKLNINMLV